MTEYLQHNDQQEAYTNPQRFVEPLTGVNVELSESIRIRAIDTLRMAENAVCLPDQSHFFVMTAVSTANREWGVGGNKESWAGKAEQHGETSAIDNCYQQFGPTVKGKIDVIGFYVPEIDPSSYAGSCGDCLDVMREHCSPDGIIVDGNPDTGIIRTLRVNQVYKDTFSNTPGFPLNHSLVHTAIDALNRAQLGLVPMERRNLVYGVSGRTRSGLDVAGVYIGMSGYHPIRPLSAMVAQLTNNAHRMEDYALETVYIVMPENLPYISYADRQVLEDHRSRQQAMGGKSDIDIVCIRIDSKGRIVQKEQTAASEWLPYPFSVGHFGMNDVLQEDAERLLHRDSRS